MKSWRNVRWLDCNHPYLEVLETVKVASLFFGSKEKGPFVVKHVQGFFYFASKREELQSTALCGNLLVLSLKCSTATGLSQNFLQQQPTIGEVNSVS